MNLRTKKSALAFALLVSQVAMSSPEFTMSYRYKNAETQQTEQGAQQILLEDQRSETNDPRIEKAIFVAKLGDLITETLTNFSKECEMQPILEPPFMPMLRTTTIPPSFPILPPPSTTCDGIKEALADSLLEKINSYATQAAGIASAAYDEKIAETFDLLRKLAANMKSFNGYFGSPEIAMGTHKFAGAHLGVGTGGAQDIGFFKNIVDNGDVPRPEAFDAKGFMSEFDLPMGDSQCDQLLCITPVYKYDSETKKLFVAVSMNTNIDEQTFVRKPLNLALVIDISGSMEATDETEKSRLAWAKDAAVKTISQLNADDYVSVVVFDSTSEVLVPAMSMATDENRAHVLNVIAKLETKGSTNLYDGLKAGYDLVSDNAQNLSDYNHRVILISDAGLNTGVTDESVNVSLVSNYAAEDIGLTAIGLGLNFNQDFILGTSTSLGGNYIYAHSGKDMVRYFSSFKFLVSPIAHQLKARLTFANTSATLVKAYGIPGESLTSSDELINVQSLFLTNQGGGAILLEYLLK